MSTPDILGRIIVLAVREDGSLLARLVAPKDAQAAQEGAMRSGKFTAVALAKAFQVRTGPTT